MFERFTERARKVVVLAQDEASRFNHNYIGTEHLLLGLLKEGEGVAARALGSLGVTLDEARGQVESIVGYGGEDTGGQAPFTPRSKKVLELSLRESMQLGHNYIGTEHILLGLVREQEGVAARVLTTLDVDPDKVRREVVRMLGVETGTGGLPGQGRSVRRPGAFRQRFRESAHASKLSEASHGAGLFIPDGGERFSALHGSRKAAQMRHPGHQVGRVGVSGSGGREGRQ
jgi:ATP-dependent Clp protease ATP-binding subunit ClpC